jgi:hypothetical protein
MEALAERSFLVGSCVEESYSIEGMFWGSGSFFAMESFRLVGVVYQYSDKNNHECGQ